MISPSNVLAYCRIAGIKLTEYIFDERYYHYPTCIGLDPTSTEINPITVGINLSGDYFFTEIIEPLPDLLTIRLSTSRREFMAMMGYQTIHLFIQLVDLKEFY